jgi:hypothetical protein
MLARASGNNSDTNMSEESDKSGKRRRTVTTIETHEVWIVRKVVPGVADEAEPLVPPEIPQTAAVLPLSEVNDSSQTIEDES